MARFSILLFLVALSCFQVSECKSLDMLEEFFHQVWEEMNFDKLVLEYRWKPSYCKKVPCPFLHRVKKDWTIRRLRAFKSNEGPGPDTEDCGGDYDRNAIADFRAELGRDWPEYKRGASNNKFWKETYEKFGTCLKNMEKFNSVTKYFRKTMEIYDKYKLKTILAAGEVTPSDTKEYTFTKILSALNEGLGVEPALYCVEEDKKQYLSGISMCFTKKLVPISCGASLVGGGDRCDAEKKIRLPKFSPLARHWN